MTAPRQILPGRTYLVTRRCTQRQFLLRPDDKTERIFLYCLAEAAARFQVEVVAWVAMSDHYHAIVEDPLGVLPDFMAHFHKMIAKVLNVRWGRRENLWSNAHASVVHLVEDRDVFDKVIYALLNPVDADLVDRAVNWPGASSINVLDGRPIRVQRPAAFFRKNGRMPGEVVLRATPPRSWRGREAEWRECIGRVIRRREDAQRAARAASGRTVVGRRVVRRASPFQCASSLERRAALNPTIACKDPDRRRVELVGLRAFRLSYRAALVLFLAGDRTAVFPTGTFRHRQMCCSWSRPEATPPIHGGRASKVA